MRMKYKKFIAQGAALILLAAVSVSACAPAAGSSAVKPDVTGTTSSAEETEPKTETVLVDEYPQINALMEQYYRNYASGDAKALKKIAHPLSDAEKSYIAAFSKYVDSYENMKCYTGTGVSDGEFVVAVTMDMKFKGIDTSASNLEYFYIRKEESGAYYIDNAYSQFNQTNQENETDKEISARMMEFEQGESIVNLQKQVQKAYDDAVASDSALEKMVKNTLQDVISSWASEYNSKADTKPVKQEKEPDNSKKNEKTNEKTETAKKRTAYTKTEVNLRKKRGTDSEILKTLGAGTKVTVYGKSQDGWYKVKAKGITGYIKSSYIVSDKSKAKKENNGKQTASDTVYYNEGEQIRLSESVNVRTAMSKDADLAGVAYQGEVVTVIMSYAEGWTKVSWNGQTGYIKTEYLK